MPLIRLVAIKAMWTKAVLIMAFGFTLEQFLFYRDWLHWQRDKVYKVRPGPCRIIKDDGGSEDIVHIGDGVFLLSSILYATSMDPLAHGMTSWKDSVTGRLFLYVLTHPPSQDKVRVFEVLKPLQLKYIKTITDPKFTFMNDLVAVGMDKFYITKYTMYRDLTVFKLEHWSHLKQGKIYYYDGRKAREVASGYFLTNGINVSPDKTMIYMAEWGSQKLHGFKRESTNNLVKVWGVDLQTGVDNIDVDDSGDLWIGCHPITWKAIDYLNIFGATPPSQVLRVKIRNHAVDVIEGVYMDDGEECSGSTVAVYRNGKLIIGSFQRQTVMCDVKYLTE